MARSCRSEHGYSLVEMVFTMALATTLMGLAAPILIDVSESSKLNGAVREVERELQAARLKAVSVNRSLRVRFNCPAAGYYRTVEVVSAVVDTSDNRCSLTAYPFPVTDTDVMVAPRNDGPVRLLVAEATVTDGNIEFRPDGTAWNVIANVPQEITGTVTITVARHSKFKSVTVNGAGKIQLQ